MNESNDIQLTGKSTIKAFEKGAIGYWTNRGIKLEEAIKLAEARGKCVHIQTVNNLVVTAGKQLLADLLIGEESVGLAYHEIGTGTTTPALADTALTTVEVRKVLTSCVRNGNQVQASVFYLASESTLAIKEAGIFGGAAATASEGSGRMLCHYLQNYDNSAGTYDLTFEYTLSIN